MTEEIRKLMANMRYNLLSGANANPRCECGMWTRGCFKKCVCCQADELRTLVEKEQC